MTTDYTIIYFIAIGMIITFLIILQIKRKPKKTRYTKVYAKLSEWIEHAPSLTQLAYLGELVDEFKDQYYDGQHGDAYKLYLDLCATLQQRYIDLKDFGKPVIGTAKRVS